MNDSIKHRSITVPTHHGLILFLLIAMLLPCNISCSGTDPGGGRDDGDGLDQSGVCRLFATRFTETYAGQTRMWTCAFDRSLLEMTCRGQIPGFAQIGRTTVWDDYGGRQRRAAVRKANA